VDNLEDIVSKIHFKKVLILNGDCRNGLAILRSLGSKGVFCDVTSTCNTLTARLLKLSFKSKYINKIHFLPDITDEKNFKKLLVEILKTENYNYLFCAGTLATNFASKNKNALSSFVQPLVEDFDKVWLVHDKVSCLKLADSICIPVPETHFINNLKDLQNAVKKIDYPVVVKYSDSFASNGLWTYTEGGKKLLEEYIKRVPEILNISFSDNFPFIQERLSGTLMDTTSFSVRGKVHAVLSQQRLVTTWLDGGGGLVNITNDIQKIKEYTKTIIKHLKWTGPIEIDWIVDSKKNSYKLLEINPKFWGTTQLTISSGFDYPYWLLQYAENESLPNPGSYSPGLMGRWIFDELSAILTVPKDKERLRNELINFFNRFKYRPCVTDIWLSDIKPSIYSLISFCKRVLWHGLLIRQLWRLFW